MSDKTARSKGPWIAIPDDEESGAYSVWSCVDGVSKFVCDTGEPFGGDEAEIEANARLIAAAPDLLSVVLSMDVVLRGFPSYRGSLLGKQVASLLSRVDCK